MGLDEVDVAFLVGEQLLEQVHAHIVLFLPARGAGFHVERACAVLGLEIAFEDLLDVLADHERIELLHVGEAFEEDDAGHELVGVMHLLDGFLALLLGELGVAPVVEQAVVQPVLIDGGEFARQRLIEILDDCRIALHFAILLSTVMVIMTCSVPRG